MHALFRRKYRTIVLLVVAAVLFYLLQCFTASKLGHLANKKSNLDAHVRQVEDSENLKVEQLLVNNGDHGRHENAEQRLAKDKEKTLKNVNKFNIERKQQEKNIVDTRKTDREKAKYHVDEHLFHMFDKDKAETPCIESKLVEQLNRTRDDRLIAASVNLFGVLDSEKHRYKADDKNMLRCLTATEVSRFYICVALYTSSPSFSLRKVTHCIVLQLCTFWAYKSYLDWVHHPSKFTWLFHTVSGCTMGR